MFLNQKVCNFKRFGVKIGWLWYLNDWEFIMLLYYLKWIFMFVEIFDV